MAKRKHRGGRPRVHVVPMRRIGLDVRLDLYERLVERANEEDKNFSEVVRDALMAAFPCKKELD